MTERAVHRILVAIDFSDCSRVAVEWAIRYANAVAPSELTFLHVLEPVAAAELLRPSAIEQLESEIEQMKTLATAEMQKALAGQPLGANVSVRYAVARGRPYVEILRVAGKPPADVIILGTHGRTGIERLLIGSVAERVVRGAPCTVITVKPKAPQSDDPRRAA